MISVQDIYIAFGDRILFDHISFLVNKGERIGLAGKNGAGKSTLLKVMAGQQTPGGGVISKPNGLKTAYLPQEIRVDSELSVKEEAAKGLSEIVTASKRIKAIEHELENSTGEDVDAIMKLTEELTALHERMDILQGYNYEENVVKILEGLGFTPEEQ
jgi:ATP-binding cassette subfamily F protein 3